VRVADLSAAMAWVGPAAAGKRDGYKGVVVEADDGALRLTSTDGVAIATYGGIPAEALVPFPRFMVRSGVIANVARAAKLTGDETVEVRYHTPDPDYKRPAIASFCGSGWAIVGLCNEWCAVPPATDHTYAVSESSRGFAVNAGRFRKAVEQAVRRGHGERKAPVVVVESGVGRVVVTATEDTGFAATLEAASYGEPGTRTRLRAGLFLPWLASLPKDRTVYCMARDEYRPVQMWTGEHADSAWVIAGLDPKVTPPQDPAGPAPKAA